MFVCHELIRFSNTSDRRFFKWMKLQEMTDGKLQVTNNTENIGNMSKVKGREQRGVDPELEDSNAPGRRTDSGERWHKLFLKTGHILRSGIKKERRRAKHILADG